MTESTQSTFTCTGCGSVVADEAKHEQWHQAIGIIESEAQEALEIAQGAANTLYQHNITI